MHEAEFLKYAEDFVRENWGHPNTANTRLKDRQLIKAAIAKRAQGDERAIDEPIIYKMRMQRHPAALDSDPEGAEETRALLAANSLTEEVERQLSNEQRDADDETAGENPLCCKPHTRAKGKDAIAEFAGSDLTPVSGGKDKWDASSLRNVAIFLITNRITLWHNDFDHKDYISEKSGAEKRLSDEVVLDLKMRMHSLALRVTTEFCHDALKWFAQKNAKHPVREYLEECKSKWDRKRRLDKMLHTYFGAEDNDYHRLVGSKWMIAAVCRVMAPGCKFDNMLVLEGPQGAKKSTSLRTLASSAWFTDGMAVGSNAKETIELTCGKWIVETAELAGLSKRDVNEVKQALSKQSDNARQSYERLASEVDRQFVFCGTTNNAQYLRDRTGNRRFWCVSVGKIDIEKLARDRDQLWAEAAHRAAEPIYLKDAEYDLALEEQAKRAEDDALEITLDDLLGDFAEGQVTKRELYKALGHSVDRGSGSIGARVLDGMVRRGWSSVREKVEGKRQWCFAKGTLPPVLRYDEDDQTFRLDKEATKIKRVRTLH